MRLHRLSMTGFGPFRDQQVVDFDELCSAGVFLLTGHTGAGKSSVLDAVTYALYGQVPGPRTSILRVRSDHADPAAPTLVELELTVRGTRLRVRRTPDWDRPKRRGEGSTRERGKVVLERLRSGTWEFVSARHDEVGHELSGLLGLTHDQFCQVVLLPQGAFAAFLGADAESRRRLLEQLFGTERFSTVESWLASLRAERGEAFVQQLDRRNELVARLAEVAEAVDAPEREAADAEVLAWADSALADLGGRCTQAAERVRAATDDSRACAAALERALEVAARQRRLSTLLERARQLDGRLQQRRADEAELGAAARAEALGPLLDTVDELDEARAAAERSVRSGRDELAGLAVPAEGTADDLLEQEQQVRAELTRLADLLADSARGATLDAELIRTDRRAAARRAKLARHRAVLAAAPAQHDRLVAGVREGELAAERVPVLDAELERARARVAAAAVRDRIAHERAAVDGARAGAAQRVLHAREELLNVRERRLDGMAAELAAGLATGAACPVCGSRAHPQLAAATEAVGELAEQEARAALEAAEAALGDIDDRRQSLAGEHAAARVAARGDEPSPTLQAGLDDLRQQLASATRAAGALPTVLEALDAYDAQTANVASAEREEQAGLDGDLARAVALGIDRDELRGRVAAAKGDDPDLPSRAQRLTAAADALAGTARNVREEAHARQSLRAAERRLARAAAGAGFDDAAGAAAALRSPARMVALTDALKDHDREAHVVAAGLAEPDLAGLVRQAADELAAQVAAADRDHSAAAAALTTAQVASGRLELARAKALRRHGDVVGAVTRLTPLRTAFEQVDGLARLVAGTAVDNRLRMRLSYYVLSARLEQVAAAASERLLRMTDGRFTLRHTDERSRGNQRSGLGLLVGDSWYGTTRDPSTLSGGEAFMASLALALGLADVVVAEAGGTVMDTLFVDEGFGSLDDQTLDAVLDVLDGLREGGRAVGLVSHVKELRDRIPAQLAVHKAHHGSTLQLTA